MSNRFDSITDEHSAFYDSITHVERVGFTIQHTNTVTTIEHETTSLPAIISVTAGAGVLIVLMVILLLKRRNK